jgi:hypothetical protein
MIFLSVLDGLCSLTVNNRAILSPLMRYNPPSTMATLISPTLLIDRSKGDVLSKGLVILQTGWFVQCIARGIERLSVTELELVTVGFATLNLVTYAFWWNKPLLQCPLGRWIEWIFFVTMGYEDYYVDLTAEKAFATFYAGDLEVKPVASAALCATVVPIIFGAIHRIAWLFPFPTHTE